MGSPDTPEFSVIVTCYFEEKSIDEFHERLTRTLRELGRSYELIFVDDGSGDGTADRLRAIFGRDENTRAIVELFCNSGQAAAVTAGCTYARGRHFVFIDSDLQLDPEDLPRLVDVFDEGGLDVVSGYRESREDSMLRTLGSRLANVVMRRVSRSTLPDLGCNFRIMNGALVRGFEPGPFKVLTPVHLVGAAGACRAIPVTHHARRYGHSGWTFRKLFSYNLDQIVDLSERPFQILSVLSLTAGLLLVLRILLSAILPGAVLGEVSNGLLLNAIAFSLLVGVGVLCVVGEYVIRNFMMLRRNPAYIARSVLER